VNPLLFLKRMKKSICRQINTEEKKNHTLSILKKFLFHFYLPISTQKKLILLEEK
jgi:hypothetical protein